MTQQDPSALLEPSNSSPLFGCWPFLRIALIAWAAIGILRFLVGFAGFGFHARGLGQIPAVLDFIGSTCLLLGALAASAPNSRNTALTIGAASLALYALLSPWLNASAVHSGFYLSAFLQGIEHVWFPVALVILKIKSQARTAEPRPIARMDKPMPLLLAAQLPGLAGMCLVGAVWVGWIRSDPSGGLLVVILILSVSGSLLSAALSLAFLGTRHGVLACAFAFAHVLYLVLLAEIVSRVLASVYATSHAPGGFWNTEPRVNS